MWLVLGEMEHHATLHTSAVQVSSSLQSTPQALTLQGNKTRYLHRWWCFVKTFLSRGVCTENIWGICNENKRDTETNWKGQHEEGEQRSGTWKDSCCPTLENSKRHVRPVTEEQPCSWRSGCQELTFWNRPSSFSWSKPNSCTRPFFSVSGKAANLKCYFDWVCVIQHPALANIRYT